MWYLAVFVPVTSKGSAEAVARAVWPDDPGAQLGIALTDAGGAAWVGGNAAVTDAEIAALQGLVTVPGVRWYRYALGGDRALGMAFPDGPVEGTPWGWSASLAAAGLTPFSP